MTKSTKKPKAKKAVKTKAKKPKLPPLAFPPSLYGKDPLRDDLRKWLVQWHKKNFPMKGMDRNFALCDRTLASVAPFMVEMLAPRTNGGKAAADVLADRYRCWVDTCSHKDAQDEWAYWVNGFDVNVYRETDDGGLVVVGGLSEFKRRKAA